MLRQFFVRSLLLVALAVSLFPALSVAENERDDAAAVVHYRKVDVDGLKVFYREAGDARKPTILLLHGFPTSSQMYRNLIPKLANRIT